MHTSVYAYHQHIFIICAYLGVCVPSTHLYHLCIPRCMRTIILNVSVHSYHQHIFVIFECLGSFVPSAHLYYITTLNSSIFIFTTLDYTILFIPAGKNNGHSYGEWPLFLGLHVTSVVVWWCVELFLDDHRIHPDIHMSDSFARHDVGQDVVESTDR